MRVRVNTVVCLNLQIDSQLTGRRAAEVRNGFRITLREMSERLGVTEQAIWKLERGRTKWTKEKANDYTQAIEAIANERMRKR